MKISKKIISILVAVVMIVSMCTVAFAGVEPSGKKTAIVFTTGIGQTTIFSMKERLVSDSKCTSCVDIDGDADNAADLAIAKAAEIGIVNDAVTAAIYQAFALNYVKFDFADAAGNVKAFAIKKSGAVKVDGICYVGADGTVHTTWADDIYDYNGEAFIIDYSGNIIMANKGTAVNDIFSNVKTYKAIVQLLETALTGKYSVKYDDLKDVVDGILKDNMLDENFNLPSNVFVPQYSCPISQYPTGMGSADNKYGVDRLYRDIPIKSLMQDSYLDGEGNIRTDGNGKLVPETFNEELTNSVFNYSHAAVGSVGNFAKELKVQIDKIVDKENGYGFDDVILVPMSMGATVASQYLYNCKLQGIDSHVSKVVSIVGCWNGSSIVSDLLYKNYHIGDDELIYSKLSEVVNSYLDGTLASVISLALRGICHNKNLKLLVSDVLDYIADFILHTPSLLTLVSYQEYENIEKEFLQGEEFANVRTEMRAYHEAQKSFANCTFEQDYPEVEFYFISGYGLGLGQGYVETNEDAIGDFTILKLLETALNCNSDEIIDIESTCPGAKSVPVGTKFSDEYMESAKKAGTDKYIDPYSASVDISGCPNPENCWLFYKQYHQLNGNQTALNLAMDIVKDNDTTGYPRFNESKRIDNGDFDLQSEAEFFATYLRNNDVFAREDYNNGLDILARSIKLMNRKQNNRVQDDKEIKSLINEMRAFEKIAPLDDSEEESIVLDVINKLLNKTNSELYKHYGTDGLRDTTIGKAGDAYRLAILTPVFKVIYTVFSVVEKFVK